MLWFGSCCFRHAQTKHKTTAQLTLSRLGAQKALTALSEASQSTSLSTPLSTSTTSSLATSLPGLVGLLSGTNMTDTEMKTQGQTTSPPTGTHTLSPTLSASLTATLSALSLGSGSTFAFPGLAQTGQQQQQAATQAVEAAIQAKLASLSLLPQFGSSGFPQSHSQQSDDMQTDTDIRPPQSFGFPTYPQTANITQQQAPHSLQTTQPQIGAHTTTQPTQVKTEPHTQNTQTNPNASNSHSGTEHRPSLTLSLSAPTPQIGTLPTQPNVFVHPALQTTPTPGSVSREGSFTFTFGIPSPDKTQPQTQTTQQQPLFASSNSLQTSEGSSQLATQALTQAFTQMNMFARPSPMDTTTQTDVVIDFPSSVSSVSLSKDGNFVTSYGFGSPHNEISPTTSPTSITHTFTHTISFGGSNSLPVTQTKDLASVKSEMIRHQTKAEVYERMNTMMDRDLGVETDRDDFLIDDAPSSDGSPYISGDSSPDTSANASPNTPKRSMDSGVSEEGVGYGLGAGFGSHATQPQPTRVPKPTTGQQQPATTPSQAFLNLSKIGVSPNSVPSFFVAADDSLRTPKRLHPLKLPPEYATKIHAPPVWATYLCPLSLCRYRSALSPSATSLPSNAHISIELSENTIERKLPQSLATTTQTTQTTQAAPTTAPPDARRLLESQLDQAGVAAVIHHRLSDSDTALWGPHAQTTTDMDTGTDTRPTQSTQRGTDSDMVISMPEDFDSPSARHTHMPSGFPRAPSLELDRPPSLTSLPSMPSLSRPGSCAPSLSRPGSCVGESKSSLPTVTGLVFDMVVNSAFERLFGFTNQEIQEGVETKGPAAFLGFVFSCCFCSCSCCLVCCLLFTYNDKQVARRVFGSCVVVNTRSDVWATHRVSFSRCYYHKGLFVFCLRACLFLHVCCLLIVSVLLNETNKQHKQHKTQDKRIVPVVITVKSSMGTDGLPQERVMCFVPLDGRPV